MMQIHSAQLIEMLREGGFPSNNLLVVVGPAGSGKTHLVQELTATLKWPLIKLGKDTSERLLGMTVRQRKLRAEEIIADVLDAAHQQKVCLDNTEILFDTKATSGRVAPRRPTTALERPARTKRSTWSPPLARSAKKSLAFKFPGSSDGRAHSKSDRRVSAGGRILPLHIDDTF
jgi:hypothetical protein